MFVFVCLRERVCMLVCSWCFVAHANQFVCMSLLTGKELKNRKMKKKERKKGGGEEDMMCGRRRR